MISRSEHCVFCIVISKDFTGNENVTAADFIICMGAILAISGIVPERDLCKPHSAMLHATGESILGWECKCFADEKVYDA